MKSRAATLVVVASMLLAIAAVTALAGEALKALTTPRLDITDGAGRVRASVRCNADGRPEIVTYAEDGTEDGRVLLSTLVSVSAKAAPTPAEAQTAAAPSTFEQMREVNAKRAAAAYGTAESLDLLLQLTVLWRDLKVEPGDVAGEVARQKQLESIGMEFIRESLAYRQKTGRDFVPDPKYMKR